MKITDYNLNLHSNSTATELKISDDKTLGVLQKSVVFLFEKAEAGVISHIDIAKQTPVYVVFCFTAAG